MKANSYSMYGQDRRKLLQGSSWDGGAELGLVEFTNTIRKIGKLTPRELSDLDVKRMFDRIDSDGRGFVDIDQLSDLVWGNSHATPTATATPRITGGPAVETASRRTPEGSLALHAEQNVPIPQHTRYRVDDSDTARQHHFDQSSRGLSPWLPEGSTDENSQAADHEALAPQYGRQHHSNSGVTKSHRADSGGTEGEAAAESNSAAALAQPTLTVVLNGTKVQRKDRAESSPRLHTSAPQDPEQAQDDNALVDLEAAHAQALAKHTALLERLQQTSEDCASVDASDMSEQVRPTATQSEHDDRVDSDQRPALHESDATAVAEPEQSTVAAVIDSPAGDTSHNTAKAEVACFSEGSTFSVSSLQAVTIGRPSKAGVSPQISLKCDDTVSRQHAEISYDRSTGAFHLKVLGKRHVVVGGILVQQADGPCKLQPMDSIIVGRTVLGFQVLGSEDDTQHDVVTAARTPLRHQAPMVHTARATQSAVLAELVAEDGSKYCVQQTTTVLGRTPDEGPVEADCLLGYNKLISRRHAIISTTDDGERAFWLNCIGQTAISLNRNVCAPRGEPCRLRSQDRISLPGVSLVFLLPGDTVKDAADGLDRARTYVLKRFVDETVARAGSKDAVIEAAEHIQLAYKSRLLSAQLLRVAAELRKPETDAATKISSAWRGFATRTSGDVVWAQQRRSQNRSAVSIQAAWRRKCSVRLLHNMQRERAATRISAAWRGNKCRSDLIDDLQWARAEREYSAKEIQRLWRGTYVRRMIEEAESEYEAATTIQAATRGWLLRLPIHRAVREIAATTIQAAARALLARAKVVTLRDEYLLADAEEAACVIQMAVMEWLLRTRNKKETHLKQVHAATTIQSNVRGWLLRQQEWRLIEEDIELERELQRQRDMQAERERQAVRAYAPSTPVLHSARSVSVNSFRSTMDAGEPTPRELRLRHHLDAIRRAQGV